MRLPNTIAAAAIAVIAAAVFAAASARAGNVVVWACHGPGGEALGAAPFFSTAGGDGLASTYGQGCEGPAGAGGLLATFSRPDPAGGSTAYWQLRVPAGVTLDSLQIARTTSGFGGAPLSGDPQWYEAETSSMSIESASLEAGDAPLGGELSVAPATGEYVRLSVGCALPGSERCASSPNGTVGVEISSVALGVLDSAPPVGVVDGVQSPVAGTLRVLLDASDLGLGLAGAEASIDEQTSAFVRLGGGSCPEHPSASATIDLPLGADCPETVSEIPLSLDTEAVADGSHQLRVSVTDAAGNTTTLLDQTIVVDNNPAPPGSNTVTLGIGSSGSSSSSSSSSSSGSGGVLGSSSSGLSAACRSPMLSMKLTSKPLRYAKHHVPVLSSGRRYVYRGQLTCLLSGHRVSAPTGTVVGVFYKIGRHPAQRSSRGTMTVHRGRLGAILGYKSSRTIIFRYRAGNGELVQVKIPIEIAHTPLKARGQR